MCVVYISTFLCKEKGEKRIFICLQSLYVIKTYVYNKEFQC